MYFVEEITHFVQEEGVSTFLELDREIWDNWLLNQRGVVRKELWIDPASPFIIKCVVTWYSIDFWQNLDPDSIMQAEQQMKDGMGNYAYEKLKMKTFYSLTTIDNGSIDDDNDQDDDDSIGTDPSYNIDDDQPSEISISYPIN
jgi:hypothetical protein